MSEPGWRPRLVALDVDGTLLAWATDRGGAIDQLTPPVHQAVLAAAEAGATIVLASGRSIHAMLPVLEALGLGTVEDPVWAVAANGAVVFQYPPVEIVHEETFDARPAVAAILEGDFPARQTLPLHLVVRGSTARPPRLAPEPQ